MSTPSVPIKRQVYTAYIVDAVRTAGGKRKGVWRDTHPVDLAAQTLDGLVLRNFKPKATQSVDFVDHVVMGCVSQIGPQGCNVARNVVLASSTLDVQTPATTVDRQCGSGLQAVALAAQQVMSGVVDIVIAGGVESMTQVPLGSNVHLALKGGLGTPNTETIHEKFPTADQPPTFSQFYGAERVAKQFNVTRADVDQYAVESHALAVTAQEKGWFKDEILPLKGKDKDGNEVVVLNDEGVRKGTTTEKLAKLPTLLPADDTEDKTIPSPPAHTAGTASQVCDGASFVLVMNEEGLRRTGLKPIARIVGITNCSDDPVVMLRAPIYGAEKLMKKYKWSIGDFDWFEVNAAFGAVPLMFMRHFNIPRAKMNPHGDAIALGHPLGATGAKLIATAVHALKTHNKKRAMITLCEGGGQAQVVVVERIADGWAKL